MKRKDWRQCQGPRENYRITNWPAYSAGLIARSDVTVWLEAGLAQPAGAGRAKHGRPRVYADATIQMLLGLKQVFRLSLRALQGFATSLGKFGVPDLRVPNYTTLCRRARGLQVTLPVLRSGEALHLVVDSTGLKLFGEGEWKVHKHGSSKRRTWRKVHLGMAVNTGQICVALMTHQGVGDAELLPARRARRSRRVRAPHSGGGVCQATEVAVRVGVLNRMTTLAPPQSVRIA